MAKQDSKEILKDFKKATICVVLADKLADVMEPGKPVSVRDAILPAIRAAAFVIDAELDWQGIKIE